MHIRGAYRYDFLHKLELRCPPISSLALGPRSFICSSMEGRSIKRVSLESYEFKLYPRSISLDGGRSRDRRLEYANFGHPSGCALWPDSIIFLDTLSLTLRMISEMQAMKPLYSCMKNLSTVFEQDGSSQIRLARRRLYG